MTTYPVGQKPSFWDPCPSVSGHRVALGQVNMASRANPPLVTIGMNPSHANESISDATVNRIIEASVRLGYPGWIMLNLYPVRESSPSRLAPFDPILSSANCAAIEKVIIAYGITEVL